MPRLLIVDDHPLSGRALGVAMGSLPGLKVIGETTCHDAIRRTVQLAPGIVVWHTEDLDRESLGVIRSISARPAAYWYWARPTLYPGTQGSVHRCQRVPARQLDSRRVHAGDPRRGGRWCSNLTVLTHRLI
jgi:hypothetical protein